MLYYRLPRPARRPTTVIMPEALEQLVLCREFVRHLLPDTTKALLEDTLHKTSALLPPEQPAASCLEPRGMGLAFGSIDYSPFQEMINGLLTAIRRKVVVSVSYTALDSSTPRQYDFVPARLLSHRESLYAQGFVVTDKGTVALRYETPITLAIQRLSEVVLTRRSSARLALPALPDSDAFGVRNEEPFRVRIRFKPGAPSTYARERRWSTDQSMKAEPDGSLVLDFTARSEDEAIAWVLGFGAQAEVLGPPRLRQYVCDAVRNMAEQYL